MDGEGTDYSEVTAMDQSVERWKQAGRIAVWMNPRTKDEHWNLTSDPLGATSLLELLDLIEAAEFPVRRTLKVTKPNFTPDHGGRWKVRVADCLRLVHNRVEFEANRFNLLAFEPKKLQLELGAAWLGEFRKAIEDIVQGGGDYSIGNRRKGSDELWVWWTADAYWDAPKPD